MKFEQSQIHAVINYLRKALSLMKRGAVEDVIRHNFTSHLYQMFLDNPRWVQHHIEGGETGVKFTKDGKLRRGFVDNLVNSTAIEYEANITVRAKFNEGYGQVKNYCAALLNEGRAPGMIIGILSDTVRWRAYRIASIEMPTDGLVGGEHIQLEEVDRVDGSAADETAAFNVLVFLIRYLGRLESRPLSADLLVSDFGFDSEFCVEHIISMRDLVENAFDVNPPYGALVEELWSRFVSFVGSPELAGAFDRSGYADELYVLTLAQLICANVIEEKVILGDRAEIGAILKGDFFKVRGLNNLVEYDYFGWLHHPPFLEAVLDVAIEMQHDLRAYDFGSAPSEDLFGQLMAQLARLSQRLLLGQAWTPRWLARTLVRRVADALPEDEVPRFIDMCCGSGAMVVEAILVAKPIIAAKVPEGDQERRIQELVLAITGFDIDPVAAILAKISWVIAARDWLQPFGVFPVTIPIYHADSLFAITPLSNTLEDEEGKEFHHLRIANSTLELPHFLISPPYQGAFDAIIDAAYELAMSGGDFPVRLSDTVLENAIDLALATATVTQTEKQLAKAFLKAFTETVDRLSREGLNGIWAFILRNSYRPGLVAGQFNGLVSNPPWLALSRIADNPYRLILRRKAEQFGISPPGPSFLHIEMATIFLLHAVNRYLRYDAPVGCIVPDSVLTGYNHNPFRSASYASAPNPVEFRVEEIWRISETTFKNLGVALIGSKNKPDVEASTFPGFFADESGMMPITIYCNNQGPRSSWSEQATLAGETGFFDPAPFRQGADIMPRTLFFHEVSSAPRARGREQWFVRPIDVNTSSLAFAVRGAKKFKDFRVGSCVLPDALFFDVLISKLLTPFSLAEPLRALLPIRKNSELVWTPLDETEIGAMGHSVAAAFRQICSAIGPDATISSLWDLLDTRSKLSQQQIKTGGYLVFTGTSGQNVCSAFAETEMLNYDRLVIDQTLNWAGVPTREEALYLVGLFNSQAINDVIRDFQPEGAFGKRHIHSLPFRATPPFDPSQDLHQNVVRQTQLLIDAYEILHISDPSLQSAREPNSGSLARRRTLITRKLRTLPEYESYDAACRSLYGI